MHKGACFWGYPVNYCVHSLVQPVHAKVATAGYISFKGTAMVQLHGVVVIVFCLHERAGQVCGFDTVLV